jgi:hypothetical protein
MVARVIALMLLVAVTAPTNDARAQNSQLGGPPSWEIEGEYEVKFDYRKNFALDRPNRDDLFRFDQEFQLRWSYRPTDQIAILLEGKLLGEHQLYTGGGGRSSEFDAERGETWIRFDQLLGRELSLKLGRQSFEEPRRWWWDDDLDTLSMRYRHASGFFELGVGQELPRQSLQEDFADPENKGVFRVLARANWLYFRNHGLDLFFLYHNDGSPTQSVGNLVKVDREDESDAKLWWGGIRASGNESFSQLGEFSYWADLGVVSGKEKLLELSDAEHNRQIVESRRRQRVQGWAVDVGARWESQLPVKPVFILGYARGSGDKKPESGSDRSFRQTGLQSNDEEFRTYGELLRPELSNLHIPVAAVQLPLFSKSHVEFAYRYFRQVHAAPFLRDNRIEAEPNGVKKNIGQEWMLYSILRPRKDVEIEMVGAAFRSGRAYGALSGKMAYSFFTQVTWEF